MRAARSDGDSWALPVDRAFWPSIIETPVRMAIPTEDKVFMRCLMLDGEIGLRVV